MDTPDNAVKANNSDDVHFTPTLKSNETLTVSDSVQPKDTPENNVNDHTDIFHDAECVITQEYESGAHPSSTIGTPDEYNPIPTDPPNVPTSHKATRNFVNPVKAQIYEQKIYDPDPHLSGMAQFLASESEDIRAGKKYNY